MSSAARMIDDLEALKRFGPREGGGLLRPAYSDIDQQAHDWLLGRMREAGLQAGYDGAGNLIGRLPANAPDALPGALVIGSHIDTVPGGGWLDGSYGVLAGLEVARQLQQSNLPRRHALEVIAFRDEEGRFGPFTGSRAMAGTLDLAKLPGLRDQAGAMLAPLLPGLGLSAESFAAAARQPGEIAAYLELHIEQGPLLEAEGQRIGVVSAIVGQARFSIQFKGQPDHAGTTPMHLRRDAFAASAEFAARFRGMILEQGGGVAVGTIGIVRVEPNAGNVVPADVRLGLEIRDVDGPRLTRLAEQVERLAQQAVAGSGVTQSVRGIHRTEPAPMAPDFQQAIAAAAAAHGLGARVMPSGAGHDAQNFARLVPTGMIFVPSIGGRSHCPEEDTARADLDAGLTVLYDVAARYLRG